LYTPRKKWYKYLKNPKKLDLNGFQNPSKRLFKEIQVLNKNQMAYQKFAIDFTLIDQIVYEMIIINSHYAHLTPFNTPISLFM
jgi:hypothetical protein